MRSLLTKITAASAALFLVLGLLAVPSASAQSTYPPSAPPPVDCDSLPGPSIAIIGTDVVVTFAQGSLTCIIRVVVEVNPVLYDGPMPIGTNTLTLPLPALEGDDHTATVTAFYAIGITKSDSVTISASALAAARAKFAAENPSVAVPATPAVAVPPQNLAFTGSDVDLPVVVGALLIGAGGLALLAARKREYSL